MEHVLRVRRDAVLEEVEASELALLFDAQVAECVDCVHEREPDTEGRTRHDRAADRLCRQHLHTAAVEEPGERCGVIGSERTRCSIHAACEEAERQGAPYSADAVHRDRSDRIVDLQCFQHVDRDDDDPFWRLVDRVAQLRTTSGADLELVEEILEVVSRHRAHRHGRYGRRPR